MESEKKRVPSIVCRLAVIGVLALITAAPVLAHDLPFGYLDIVVGADRPLFNIYN
jgi:hypothetical protein